MLGEVTKEETKIHELCIQIEVGKAHFFYTLMKRFSELPELRGLWQNLCEEGQSRAAALRFIQEEGEQGRELAYWEPLGMDSDQLDHLLRLVERYQRRVRSEMITPDDAFKMALRLKTSGVDEMYENILGAVDLATRKIAELAFKSNRQGLTELAKAVATYSTDGHLVARVRRLVGGEENVSGGRY
jgi:hypothetical protein